jgi:peptidoglycan/LPS O-acetylase OafA/YrhL
MTRDLHHRWWRLAAACALLFALALLLIPQVQHGHASLLLLALAPVLLVFCVAAVAQQRTSTDERVLPLSPALPLPSLSHLPPPGTLA